LRSTLDTGDDDALDLLNPKILQHIEKLYAAQAATRTEIDVLNYKQQLTA
jgi:hypothetical protein